MASIVKSCAISGVDGYVVDVETKTIVGQPMISIVGLGDAAVKEARERVESAIVDAHFVFPEMKIVINLAPSDLKKSGSHFDLPIAIGLLIEDGQMRIKRNEEFAFFGELSLNAMIRGCNGILPMVIAAKNSGIKNIVVPKANIKEASVVKDLNIYGFSSLREVVEFLEKKREYAQTIDDILEEETENQIDMDFIDVQGQDALIEFIVVAAAGGHNMLMIGPPGCGKSMIAQRIPTILPSMTESEALEVTKIYSVAGLMKANKSLIETRPFRSPHHNASLNSLIGGGNNATPGEISLAHNGILFLDEITEFSKKTLDSLRQPMEDRKVTISRVRMTNSYPANFMLVAAMNPCPCGYYGDKKCKCTDYEVLKYRQKISGPISDRIDIQKYVHAIDFMNLSSFSNKTRSSELKTRVEFARNIQNKRYEKFEKINCNAQMGQSLIKEYCTLEEDSRKVLQLAYDRFSYSARSFHKYLKVARTFADMEGSEKIRKKDILLALMARDLDKESMHMTVV